MPLENGLAMANVGRRRSQRFLTSLGDGILFWGVKIFVDFRWQMFSQFSPGKIGLKFVTENFTTFSTAREENCHLELTLGASSPNERGAKTYHANLGGGGVKGNMP